MKHRRRFTIDFKRRVVQEFLSRVGSIAQLMRRHDISPGLLYHWKDRYAKGRFENLPSQETALKERPAALATG
jgi:transposase